MVITVRPTAFQKVASETGISGCRRLDRVSETIRVVERRSQSFGSQQRLVTP